MQTKSLLQVEVEPNLWHSILLEPTAEQIMFNGKNYIIDHATHCKTKAINPLIRISQSLLYPIVNGSVSTTPLPYFEAFSPDQQKNHIELLWELEYMEVNNDHEEWLEATVFKYHDTTDLIEYEENFFLPITTIRYRHSPIEQDNVNDQKIAFIDEQRVVDVETGVVVAWKYFGEEFIEEDDEPTYYAFTRQESEIYINEMIPKLLANALEPHREVFDNLPFTIQTDLGKDIITFKENLSNRIRSSIQYDKFGHEAIIYHGQMSQAFIDSIEEFKKLYPFIYK